jgi:hypothetical protein
MRGSGLRTKELPVMTGAMRASGATVGAGDGCPAPNQALLLTRKIRDGKACPRLAAAASLEDRCRRAAERQPLGSRS